MRLVAWPLLLVFMSSTAAFAQDDDDLAPLAPKKKPPAPKARPRPQPPKPKPVAQPVGDDDDLAPIAASKSDLTIKSSQGLSNAMLSIDGKELGVLPLGPQTLPAGEHTVKVHRIGYADFVKKVTLAAGKPLELDAKLVAINAVVSVTSDVPDAQVFVNGRSVGTAPITELELPAGAIELSVRKDGFKEDKQRLTLVAGKDYPVVVKFNPGGSSTLVASKDRPVETSLTPIDDGRSNAVTGTVEEAPITTKWYFWAGVAAVAAGVVIGSVLAANASANATPRPLTEGELCGSTPSGKCAICIGLMCSPDAAAGLLNF